MRASISGTANRSARPAGATCPAPAAVFNVHDIAKWMNVQLAGGVYAGSGDNAKRLFSEQRQREMDDADADPGRQTEAMPELAPTMPISHGLRAGLEPVRLRRRAAGLAHRRLARAGLAADPVPGKKLGVIVL